MNAQTEAPPSPAPRRPRRLRWLKVLLGGAAALLLLWLAAFAHATWRLHAARAALKERGEPTTFEEAVAANQANAFRETGADQLRRAIERNNRLGRPGDDASNATGSYSTPLTRQSAGGVQALLTKGESAIALLEQAAARPPGPHTTLEDLADLPKAGTFPVAQDVRSLARHLAVDVRAAVAMGDSRRAYYRLKLLYGLTEQMGAEPFVVPQLVRLALLSVAHSTACAILPDAEFTSKEWREFSDLMLRQLRELRLAAALANERTIMAAVLESSPALADQLERDAWNRLSSTTTTKPQYHLESAWAKVVSSPLGLPARRYVAADALSIPSDVLALVDAPPRWPADAKRRFDEWHEKTRSDRLWLVGAAPAGSAASAGMLGNAASAGLRARRRLVLMALAFRLKSFDLIHRRLPETLEELCDASMPEVPLAWFEDRPVAYSVNGKRFRLEANPSITPDQPMTSTALRVAYGFLMEIDLAPRKPDDVP